MKKVKILHLAYSSNLAGGERVILTLLKNLPYEQAVVVPSAEGNFVEELQKKGCQYYVIPFKTTYSLSYSWKLAELIKQEKFDLLISHGLLVNLLGRVARLIARYLSKDFKLFNVIHLTNQYGLSFGFRFIYYYLYEFLTLGWVDRFIAVSKGVKRYFIHFFPYLKNKVEVIYNSADEKEIKKYCRRIQKIGKAGFKQRYKKIYNLQKYRRIYLSISRLAVQKNLVLLLELSTHYPEDLFLVIGEGSLREFLEEKKASLGVTNVVFVGYRKKAYRYMALADLFILPSLWEGFPITILEAFYFRLPVLASQIPGVTEAIQHQENGYLADYHKVIEFVEGIKWLLEHRKKVAESAYLTYTGFFSEEEQAIRYQKLIERLLKSEE